MGRHGRWTQAATAERRQKVLRFMVEYMRLRDEALKEIAQRVDADVRTVRADLDSLGAMSAVDRPSSPLPQELARELEHLESVADLAHFQRRCALDRAAGRLTLGDARYLSSFCRVLERSLAARSNPKSDADLLLEAFAAAEARALENPCASPSKE